MFKRIVCFVFLLSSSLYSTNSLAEQAVMAPPSAEDFAIRGDRSFSISKDGKKIAFLTGDMADAKLIILDAETGDEIPINLGKETKPRSVYWADNDHLLITVSFSYNDDENSRKNNYKYEFYRTLSYSTSAKNAKILSPSDKLDRSTNLPILYIDSENKKVTMGGYYPWGSDFVYSLFSVDLDTGKGKEIITGNDLTEDFYLDRNGKPRLRLDIDAKNKYVKLYDVTDKKNKLLLDLKDTVKLPFSIQGFLDYNTLLILDLENNKSIAKKYKFETNEVENYFSDEKYDVSNIIIDPYTKTPLGIAFEGYVPSVKWFDDKLENYQSLLKKTFPDKYLSIIDWDEKFENLIVNSQSGNQKSQTYIYNTKSKTVSELAFIPDSFLEYDFPIKTIEKFKASDGLEIPVFITRPKNPNKKKMPAILLPHGGPKAQDDISFDYISQFLSTRGFIVIQPQFRGSTGNGGDFSDAGYGEWAGKMQTDTIEALDYAISKGDVDKNRVCIVGASYGGYAALVGAAQDADKFKCAVSYGGVFDLAAMQRVDEYRSGGISPEVIFWREHIGLTRFDTKKIHAISPIYMVEKITSPILLVHGTDDTVVMPEQSQKMYAALKKAGKDVKYIELKDEDHWLSREKTRAQFLKEMENFLVPILKPQE